MNPIAPLTASGCPMGPPPGLLRTWMGHVRENRAAARAAKLAPLPPRVRPTQPMQPSTQSSTQSSSQRTPAHAGHR